MAIGFTIDWNGGSKNAAGAPGLHQRCYQLMTPLVLVSLTRKLHDRQHAAICTTSFGIANISNLKAAKC